MLYKMLHAANIENGTLTFQKLANDLRKELLKGYTTQMPNAGRVVAKGAFGPSFADLDNTEQPKEDEQETKGRGKGKRKITTKELLAKCPICRI